MIIDSAISVAYRIDSSPNAEVHDPIRAGNACNEYWPHSSLRSSRVYQYQFPLRLGIPDYTVMRSDMKPISSHNKQMFYENERWSGISCTWSLNDGHE